MNYLSTPAWIILWSLLGLFLVSMIHKTLLRSRQYKYTSLQTLYALTDLAVIPAAGFGWIVLYWDKGVFVIGCLAPLVLAFLITGYVGIVKSQAVKHTGYRSYQIGKALRGREAKKDAYRQLITIAVPIIFILFLIWEFRN